MPFALHPRLAQDTVEVARIRLCRVLLLKDRRFRWLILVPERKSVREIHEFAAGDRAVLVKEEDGLSRCALGRLLPQFHIHVVARQATDPAWPGAGLGSGAVGVSPCSPGLASFGYKRR